MILQRPRKRQLPNYKLSFMLYNNGVNESLNKEIEHDKLGEIIHVKLISDAIVL